MHFKQPAVADAHRLLEFFNDLVLKDQERVERPADVKAITHEMEIRWIESLLDKEQKQDAIALCVFDDAATLIGLGEIERRPRWIERHVAEIRFGLFPDQFNAGKSLVDLLELRAKSIGIEMLYYFHLATQQQGIEIIRACGFELAGRLPAYYKKADSYVDRVFYTKRIV
jgi:RimJ/RimL family protein N-acetyltransferase